MNHLPRIVRPLLATSLPLALLLCFHALRPFEANAFARNAAMQPADGQARRPATSHEAESQPGQFYGLYRGIVVSGPDAHMRVQVEVPTLKIPGEWAMPCLPAGSSAVPPLRSQVWIMFEQGDTHYPVWIGVIPQA